MVVKLKPNIGLKSNIGIFIYFRKISIAIKRDDS